MVIGGVMLIVGITSASLTCRPLCCSSSSSSQQGLVYYQAHNQVDIASLNLPRLPNLPLPAPLLSSAQVYYFCLKIVHMKTLMMQVVVPPCAPPAYQEVVSFTNPLASEAGNLSNQEVAGSGSKKYQRFWWGMQIPVRFAYHVKLWRQHCLKPVVIQPPDFKPFYVK